MAALEDLWQSLFPAARPVAPLNAEQCRREVSWVRVLKARVPAFDALDRGDLAVVPAGALAALAAGLPGMAGLVEELDRAGVAAMLLVAAPETGQEQALNRLGEEAAAAGMPAFRLAGGDPSQLERGLIGYLVNRRAELDRQAARLESILEQTALRGGGLEAMVAATAGFLGRAVALEGRRGDPLAVHAPADVPAAAAAVARYMSRPRNAAFRVALPSAPPRGGNGGNAATQGGPGWNPRNPGVAGVGTFSAAPVPSVPGSIALLGEGAATELERVALERVAGLIALELARDSAVRVARDAARQSEPLPADGPPWVVLVARQAGARSEAGGVQSSVDQREDVRREIRLLGSTRRLALRGDAQSLELRAVVAADSGDPGGLVLAGRIASFLGRTVALSRPFREAAGRSLAEAEARATLEAAERLPDRPSVARGDRLPAYRLLGDLHNLPGGIEHARALLAPLLNVRPAVQRERLATLRAILEQPGLGEAAAALGVHRNTIAYRIRRYEQMTGWGLTDPELRLALSLAVRLVQTEQ